MVSAASAEDEEVGVEHSLGAGVMQCPHHRGQLKIRKSSSSPLDGDRKASG